MTYLYNVQVAFLGGDVERGAVVLVAHVDQTLHLGVRQQFLHAHNSESVKWHPPPVVICTD